MEMSRGVRTEQDPAEIYAELFVPAVFAEWGPRVAEAAAIGLGQRVLDVGCGTGVLARAAAERAGPQGEVVGIDPNPMMLAVARRKPNGVLWQSGRAEALPFDDASFDAVVSQFALMFFESKPAAIAEMLRVLRPGGRLAVAVWASLDRAPGYLVLTDLLRELFGADIAAAMQAPFTVGDRELLGLIADAGAAHAEVQTLTGSVCFASIDAMISAERACVWTLGGMLSEEQLTQLRRAAQDALQPFIRSDASVQFDCSAHLATGTRA